MAHNKNLVNWVLENNDVNDDQTIFVDAADPTRQLTKSNVRRLVRQLVGGFYAENDHRYLGGDVVCLNAFNDILYPVFFLGVVGAGGCFTGANPANTVPELVHHFRLSKTKYIVTEVEHLDRVMNAAFICEIPLHRVFVLDRVDTLPGAEVRSWTHLTGLGEADIFHLKSESAFEDTTAALFNTSGTTGLPKMAARSHKSFVEEAKAINTDKKPYSVSRLVSIPMFHAFAAPLCQISAVKYGFVTYIMRRFVEKDFLATIEQNAITETAVVPPMVAKFLSGSIADKAKQMRSLRLVVCAGAHLDANLQKRANAELLQPEGRMSQIWGLTEIGWIATFSHPEKDESGSVGRLLPGYTHRVIDSNGDVMKVPGATGEICIKSPTMMSGYLDNPAATKESIDDQGWLHTGDIGRVESGKIFIVDRRKELIKVRGWQVSPAELEGVLLQHPSIEDAGVVGVLGDEATGSEYPRAHVVRKSGCKITTDQVKDFLSQNLARYKVSECMVVFCDQIPRNASGKILRRMLAVPVESTSGSSKARRVSAWILTALSPHRLFQTLLSLMRRFRNTRGST